MDYYLNDQSVFGIGGRLNNRTSKRIASSQTLISNTTEANGLFSENSYDSERVDFNFNPYYEFKSDSNRLLIDYNYTSQLMNKQSRRTLMTRTPVNII